MFKNKKTIAFVVAQCLVMVLIFIPITASAIGFGGRIIAYIPAIVPPLPACPAHIVVNNVTKAPPIIGIYFPAGVFKYFYTQFLIGATPLFIPPGLPIGAWFLGQFDPIPFATCATPYPVVPVTTIFGIYFLGSSLIP